MREPVDGKCVLIPHFKSSHYTIYGLNRITGTFDIFDTRRYKGFHITRGQHHEERVEVARRLVAVMKEVYGEEEYNKKNHFDWVALAEKCNYVQTPEQGANECAFYVLKLATILDGEKFVEKIKSKDVSNFSHPFYLITRILF
ncbi:hypothetical protein BRADI_1g56426v3 [Brachypodium distachyon]|uniref:Ubiquitin-like protease family profile domain-containing protein n=1 Tax=Brachypodium distachyon TaxID=15368 RepID=A0A2K2DRR3_BRADI|nr:hypothetical protein BRADI_1g56426v3 [Brachypodium distachyon]